MNETERSVEILLVALFGKLSALVYIDEHVQKLIKKKFDTEGPVGRAIDV